MTIKQTGGIFGRNPTFNDVDVDGDLSVSGDSSVSGDTTTKRLSVGTSNSPPSPYSIYLRSRSDSGNLLNTLCEDLDSGVISGQVLSRTDYKTAEGTGQIVASQRVEYTNAIGGVKFVFATSSNGSVAATDRVTITDSGNLAFQSGKGIDFSATSGTGTSELLDDYEEGTWTPLVTDGTNDATMYSSASNDGRYTKIGRAVTFTAMIGVNTINSVGANAYISGLPFTNAGASANRAGVTFGYGASLSITAGRVITGYVEQGLTHIKLFEWDATFGVTTISGSQITDNGQFFISGTYFTA